MNDKTIDRNPCPCSRCGKDMKDPDTGACIIGVVIEFGVPNDFLRRQYGRYAAPAVYQFCYECWLDSLFGVNMPESRVARLTQSHCGNCYGTGAISWPDGPKPCTICGGTGRLAGEGGR